MPSPTLREQLTSRLFTAKAQLQDLDAQAQRMEQANATAKAQLQAHIAEMETLLKTMPADQTT